VRLFGRREKPPEAAMSRLARDERVVSWASTPDGGAVVATQLGLWLPGAAARLPWHLVDKASWRDARLTVTPAVDTGDGVLVEQAPVSVALSVPRDLPQTVRVRVQRAIAYTSHSPLPSGGGVRVVGRRVAGRDGVTWQRVFDPGVDPDDPAVRSAVTRLVERARVELGV
jgi:hypothetical protein